MGASVPEQYGDYQLEIYRAGLHGILPRYPVDAASLESKANASLPTWVRSYLASGCGDEHTQRANVAAFTRYGITPRMLNAHAQRDLSVTLWGIPFPTPLFYAPIGIIGLMTQDLHGDIQVAKASAATGVPMIASTLTQDPMEKVATYYGDTPGIFQLYVPNDRDLALSFITRAQNAGYKAIVVTVDTWTLGWRPGDLNLANFPQLRGLCLENYFSDPLFLARLAKPVHEDLPAAANEWVNLWATPLQWSDLEWLRAATSVPLIVKGICHPDDAKKAIDEYGVDGIYCSNHGGRQANGGKPALFSLPEVVAAVDHRVPVLFDSGVRSGSDVAKALALGADAVGLGRPYAHALAVGGLDCLTQFTRGVLAELDLNMAIDGHPTIADVQHSDIGLLP